MTARAIRRSLVGLIACASPVALVACSDDAPASVMTTTTASPVTTAAPPTPVEGCPSGTWAVPQATLQDYFGAVGAMTAVSIIVTGDGELRLGTDGRMALALPGFRFAQDAGGTRIDLVFDGSIDGTYTVSGSVMTTAALVANGTALATNDGTDTDVDPVLANFVEQFPFDEARFQCSGDQLLLDLEISDTPYSMTLDPATAS